MPQKSEQLLRVRLAVEWFNEAALRALLAHYPSLLHEEGGRGLTAFHHAVSAQSWRSMAWLASNVAWYETNAMEPTPGCALQKLALSHGRLCDGDAVALTPPLGFLTTLTYA